MDENSEHWIDGYPCEEAEDCNNNSVFYAEGDEPIAVRCEDFTRLEQENKRLREKLTRYQTLVCELEHDSIPDEEDFPCCADRATEVQDMIKKLRNDLAEVPCE